MPHQIGIQILLVTPQFNMTETKIIKAGERVNGQGENL